MPPAQEDDSPYPQKGRLHSEPRSVPHQRCGSEQPNRKCPFACSNSALPQIFEQAFPVLRSGPLHWCLHPLQPISRQGEKCSPASFLSAYHGVRSPAYIHSYHAKTSHSRNLSPKKAACPSAVGQTESCLYFHGAVFPVRHPRDGIQKDYKDSLPALYSVPRTAQ